MQCYEGTDGHCYTEQALWKRLETGTWRVCCWDTDTGLEVVETDENDLLFLVPKDGDDEAA